MSAWKILVVDDEPDLELLITQRFRRQVRAGDYAFVFARDGAEALRLIAADPAIDLVLSDINMPVMDGLALLAELARQPTGLRAVIVSAYGDMSNIRTAMNRGAFDFVTKPIDMADLDITIRKTTEEIARLREIRRQRDEAQRMRANLARYFSPNIVEVLAEQDEPLGPVRRQDVAVLFADIVGYTGLAETMAPEEVMQTLRDYHGRMSKEIFACGGTLEKFIGDAMLATFGVPHPSERDAGNALRCADLMFSTLSGWNAERRAAGLPEISMGIGLNYGPAVLGDLGGKHGMAFAVIGDTVNTSSRLQDLTRILATPLVASDALVQAAGTADCVEGMLKRLRPAGERQLRGRAGAIKVWTLAPSEPTAPIEPEAG
ncbi:MAG: response regulator [Methylobacteriaceae bacterium]|nr:response regulator [Methylobacteriaceae bacterium]MBV9220933.1 response regulator [Methylobacteriaceae bacterium]